jgi:O-antigen/teichoic acid export membrane protein
MMPAVVGYPTDMLTAAIARSARMATVVGTVIGLAIVATGPVLVGLVYGSAYAAVGSLLPILVLDTIISGATWVLMQGVLAAGRPGIVTTTQFAALALSVPLFLVLVPAAGPRGAAMAMVTVSIVRLGMVLASYRLWLGAPLPRIWLERTDLADIVGRVSSLLRTGPAAWLRSGAAE